MADNDLQVVDKQFVHLAEGVKCRVCTKDDLRNGISDINEQVLEQVKEEEHNISIRIIKTLFDQRTHEYCNHINGSMLKLKVNYDTHSIVLAINPDKLPDDFVPVYVDPFNPEHEDRINELVKQHSC